MLVVACVAVMTVCGCEQSTVKGPEGERMTVSVPSALTLHRGQYQTLEVAVDRGNFSGPVTLSIAQLPNGVTVKSATQTIETDKAVFVLTASDSAEIVGNQQVKIIARSPSGAESTQYVSVSVAK